LNYLNYLAGNPLFYTGNPLLIESPDATRYTKNNGGRCNK
jgi:hypothetical protein